MPEYTCNITETRGESWAAPGVFKRKYNYKGDVNMNGYTDSAVDSTHEWSCKEK